MTYKVIDGTAELRKMTYHHRKRQKWRRDLREISGRAGADQPTVVISKDARGGGLLLRRRQFMKALAVGLNMKHEQLRYDNNLVARMRYVAEAIYQPGYQYRLSAPIAEYSDRQRYCGLLPGWP